MKGGLERGALAAEHNQFLENVIILNKKKNTFATLPAGPLLGVGVSLLWIRAGLSHRAYWVPVVLFTVVGFLPVAIAEWTLRPEFASWFAPVLLAIASAVTFPLMLQSRVRCSLCNRRFGRGDVAFRCPRCTQTVCDESCWDFEHRRCRLCLEQRVPVLPVQDGWWTRVAGPRAQQGRCNLCLSTAETADLRLCPHCRRPQCRGCCDFNNGECARCGRALPDLPPALTIFFFNFSETTEFYTP